MSIADKSYLVTMPDGSQWAVPVRVIAESRAAEYAAEFGGDVQRSLAEDTLPLFESDGFEVRDWAQNNMNWSDVKDHAKQVTPPASLDFDEGWINGDYEIN